jgi:ankyrin repeat protein
MDPYERILSSESENWSYSEFLEALYPASEYADGVVIAFAGLEDSSKLRQLIDKAAILSDDHWYTWLVDQRHDFKFVTPLLRAIERQRPANVSLLLEHDANPDGVWYDRQTEHSRRYRRFCFDDPLALSDFETTPQSEDVGTVPSQIEPPYLNNAELDERRTTISPFWTNSLRMVVDHSRDSAQWHSVVKAGTATSEILDLLLDAGADITAWCEPTDDPLPKEEEELQPSQLCISTPVHAALASGNRGMLQKLFDSGISPNARALITGNQALTPAQYAIMLGDLESYNILIDNGADISITTPVFNVHALHFAAAQLRIDLMAAIIGLNQPVGATPVTNMGHTLMHIACLPLNRSQLQTSSHKVCQSIHDIRHMGPKFQIAMRRPMTYNEHGEEMLFETLRENASRPVIQQPPEDPKRDHAKQEAMCKFVVAAYKDGPRVSYQDKHGNNMLHYLASARYPNTSLIEWAKQQGDGVHAWESDRNFWGFTAQDLYEESKIYAKPFGRDIADLESLYHSESE